MVTVSAETLRREFDESFALPRLGPTADIVELLAIRVGGQPYALRISEIGAVITGRPVTPLPTLSEALLGLVGIKGSLVAVFDLVKLLGEVRLENAPRWVALCTRHEQLGLAFHELEGHLRVPQSVLHEPTDERRGLVTRMLVSEGSLRPILSVPKLVETILGGTGRERPGKER